MKIIRFYILIPVDLFYKTLDETNFAIIEKDKPKPNALKKGYTLISFIIIKIKVCRNWKVSNKKRLW